VTLGGQPTRERAREGFFGAVPGELHLHAVKSGLARVG